jgi:hypothetical protein
VSCVFARSLFRSCVELLMDVPHVLNHPVCYLRVQSRAGLYRRIVEGRFVIDLAGRTVELSPRQGFTVPKVVQNRTRAPERRVILMIEGAGVVPTSD